MKQFALLAVLIWLAAPALAQTGSGSVDIRFTSAGQEAAADWVTLFDQDNGIAHNSFRVFDFGLGLTGSSNIGSVDLIGRFGSLAIEGFANPRGGFLTAGNDPLPPDVGGGGGGTVPEPATWAMLIAGFGLVGRALRRQRRSLGQALSA